MPDQSPHPPSPLVLARDHLRAAQDVLTHERGVNPSAELDAVLDDLMALLLRLRAVGNDNAWSR